MKKTVSRWFSLFEINFDQLLKTKFACKVVFCLLYFNAWIKILKLYYALAACNSVYALQKIFHCNVIECLKLLLNGFKIVLY